MLTTVEHMLVEHLPSVVPSSLLGKALQYMNGQWPKLVRYVENGNWPISNNLCENAIRPFVVGRRRRLFSDTVAGAQAGPGQAKPSQAKPTMHSLGMDVQGE